MILQTCSAQTLFQAEFQRVHGKVAGNALIQSEQCGEWKSGRTSLLRKVPHIPAEPVSGRMVQEHVSIIG
jgi:hypothetical protein